MKSNRDLVNFLFEVGFLAQTPRALSSLLGTVQQSVAEHIHRVVHVALVLAQFEPEVNREKLMLMALYHDLAEARISDLGWVHQKYTERLEDKAIADLAATVEFGGEMQALFTEYHQRQTREAILVKDADSLELLLLLKEQIDLGNKKAESWIPSMMKRFRSDQAKLLAEEIMKTPADSWWMDNQTFKEWADRKIQGELGGENG